MFKKALVGISLLAASSIASANLIVTEPVITGADMAGITVTVNFADGTSDSGIWEVISDTLLNTGNPVIDSNNLSGGVVRDSWSLTQGGYTLGGADDNGLFYGLWNLTNISSSNITGFFIDGQPGNIAFDIDPNAVGTPNSKTGLHYVSEHGSVGSYFSLVDSAYTDLFWALGVTLDNELVAGEEFKYFADTDKLAEQVTSPATVTLVLAGLALFMRRQSRNSHN